MPADPTIVLAGLQALLAVPGALNDTQQSLRDRRPDPRRAAVRLEAVREHMFTFAQIGHWFTEIKQLHQRLQALDIELGFVPMLHNSIRTSPGAFVEHVEDARGEWDRTRNGSFAKLTSFARLMRFETDRVMIVFPDGSTARAPRWFRTTLERYERVEEYLRQWAGFGPENIPLRQSVLPRILDSFDALRGHVSTEMAAADDRIVAVAQDIGDALLRTASEIRNA